jgi:4-hydroxy-3-methylbut-2-en-1-yl diphosphate reductase
LKHYFFVVVLYTEKYFSIIQHREAAVKILRAEHLGMCFGVRDAIAVAHQNALTEPVTILGELVHNESVLAMLRERGIDSQNELASVTSRTVMVTAHGASQKALRRIRERGLKVVEATCPLVHRAHEALTDLVRAGYYPVVIGLRGHVEVRGMTEDLDEFEVVLSEEEVKSLRERLRFGIVAQTTQPISKVRHLVQLICRRFPQSEVKFSDTVCQPTKQRQSAAVKLARQSDVVLVIGGNHSNNTHELIATCSRFCSRVFHLQDPSQLRPEWFTDAETVGITAGTSTPDAIIDAVEHWLVQL